MKSILSLLIFFTLTSFVTASDKSRGAQIDDIREALFRHQFAQQTNGVRFLSIGETEKDPSNQFVKRFADDKIPIRKISSCKYAPYTGVPTDKKTGTIGIIYFIHAIKWTSDVEVEATGGCYMANQSGEGYRYILKKENGAWKVTKEELVAVS